MATPSRYTKAEIAEFVTKGFWNTTISLVWDRNAVQFPHGEAIADLKTTLSWSEAKQWTDNVALNFLELKLNRDELIVVQLPNCVELLLLRVACEKAGVLCMPVTANMRQNEMRYILKEGNARGVVIPGTYKQFDYFDMLEQIHPELPSLKHIFTVGDNVPEGVQSIHKLSRAPLGNSFNDAAGLEGRRYRPTEVSIINLTTGSTGFPKFVEYTAGANAAWGEGQVPVLKLTSNDNVAAFAPAARGPSLPAYYDAPVAAAKIFMFPWNDPDEALRLIQKNKISVVCMVPTQISKILEQFKSGQYDLNSVRLWYSAGALISPALVKEVEAKMGGKILSDYGAVDFGGIILPDSDDPQKVRTLTVGKPRFGTEVKILDDLGNELPPGNVGEIVGRGPTSASGYYKDPEATSTAWTKDGWFATGDLGKLDEQGNLVIVGRKKNVIIRGGQNIYPGEIEALLITHPKIKETAVVAMPDPVMGERACVYVALREGQALAFEEMITFLREKNIAAFKLPERLELVDTLPLVSEQKVDIQMLRKDIEDKIRSERENTSRN